MGLPALEILPQPCGRTGQRGKKQDLGHESVFRSCFLFILIWMSSAGATEAE